MREIVPETLYEHEDSHGKWYEIVGNKVNPMIEVFPVNDGVAIRQEGDYGVDLVELTEGQAYDLLIAVSRALEIPVRF